MDVLLGSFHTEDYSGIFHSWSQAVIGFGSGPSFGAQSVGGSGLNAAATYVRNGSCLCADYRGWGPLDSEYNPTPCFLEGVLSNLPNLIILILGTLQVKSIAQSRSRSFKYDYVSGVKLLLCFVQAVFYLIIAFNNFQIAKSHSSWTNDIWVWAALINFLVISEVSYVHYVESFKSYVACGSLLFYWLLTAFNFTMRLALPYLNGDFQETHYQNNFTWYILVAVNALLVLAVEIYFPPNKTAYAEITSDPHLSPFETANVFSKIMFNWMSPLMKEGYEKFLTEDDLPDVPFHTQTNVTTTKFEHYWQQEVDTKSKPSITNALFKAFGAIYTLAGVFKIVQDCLGFVQPQLLRLLIKFVNDYLNGTETSLGRGVTIAIMMFLVAFLQTSSLHQYFQIVFETGMFAKSSLTSSIFRKALSLSNEERAKKSTGDIVNLMSVDTQRIQDMAQFAHIVWSAPLQLTLCLLSLHGILGNSMWAGVFIMLIMIPINAFIARYQKDYQKQQMKNKDMRSRFTSEILTNIKSLKLYGWEIPYIDKLNHIRNDLELATMKTIGYFGAVTTFLWNSSSFFVSCCTFGVFVLTQDKPLTTDIVFPALALFNMLSFPLAVIPNVITSLIETSVALGRLSSFLLGEELQPDAVTRLPRATSAGEDAVIIKNGTFLWERHPEYKVALMDIDFTAKKGQLSCVVGKVGSGKSSFLQSLLGDLYKSEGSVTVKGSVAYVAQVPWIMNATFKDNIIFGHEFDPEFYQTTIAACALTDDLAVLPDGDQTFVGEKGISLSGGQKARLSLARAVYARADVYLLDDPLSAVDEHVGRHIIDNILGRNGLLSTKTIVLATNSIPVLSHAHQITMLREGKVVESLTADKILESKGAIYQLLLDFGRKHTNDGGSSLPPSSTSSTASLSTQFANSLDSDSTRVPSQRRLSIGCADLAPFAKPKTEDHETSNDSRKEHVEQGKVKWAIYKEYAKASGYFGVICYIIMQIISMGLTVLGNLWLKHWSEVNTGAHSNPDVWNYLGVYLALGLLSSALIVIQSIILNIHCAIRAAKLLHEKMLRAVLRAPMSFFETTPLGRILNRFSSDIYKIDQILPRSFSAFFGNVVRVTFTILVITFSTPAFIVVAIPLAFVYVGYQKYYLRTSREVKRLDSVTKSPVYAHFQETLGGISTVRGYNQQERFSYINEARVDLNLKAYYPSIGANRWLAVRLEFIGALIIFAAALFSVLSLPSGRMSAGIVGLALSYALSVTQSLNWIVRMTVEVETNIVSVERVMEYSDLKSEAPGIIENSRPPATWPAEGSVKFNNYSTRYRPGLPCVLKGISLDIKPREKIGIVGRTGAGKSSLTLALFRIIEAVEGNITIDAIDTSSIGLLDLRQRLSIIPQDSQVFEGTLRDNLDPEGIRDDAELWRALELSHLKAHVQDSMSGGLDAKISEGGSNLSVGQRQLMCLARALLTPSKILVLDEATAAVDVETDKILQETIRTEFVDRTILTIAHRLNTIMDSDRIVVLSEGKIAEFDSPAKLLADSNSMFYSLAKQGGLEEESTEKTL